MAYFDQNRVTQAKAKAEQKHNVTLSMEACVTVVKQGIVRTDKEKAKADQKKLLTNKEVKVDYSDIFQKCINSTFFGNPINAQLFSAYRCFLGSYFVSFKKVKLKPKKNTVQPVVLKQADLFS